MRAYDTRVPLPGHKEKWLVARLTIHAPLLSLSSRFNFRLIFRHASVVPSFFRFYLYGTWKTKVNQLSFRLLLRWSLKRASRCAGAAGGRVVEVVVLVENRGLTHAGGVASPGKKRRLPSRAES